MTDEIIEVPDLTTAIPALRQWHFDPAYGVLRSTGRCHLWTTEPVVAKCLKDDGGAAFTLTASWTVFTTGGTPPPPKTHDEGVPVPGPDCACGVYGSKSLTPLPYGVGESGTVITGVVALSGRVLVHAEGYRAEMARIVAFIDPCAALPWVKSKPKYHRYLDWAVKQYGVPVFPTAPRLGQDVEDWLREA